jgi:hypothetical protein
MTVNLSPPWDGAYTAAKDILFALSYALRGAAIVAGKPLVEPFSIPDSEQDVPVEKIAPVPFGVLGNLADLWIISDEADPRVKLIENALPYIAHSRPNTPVKVGNVCAKSVSEALLRAAQFITQSLRRGFGCGSLIQLIQTAYPRDIPADPWDFNLALAWFASFKSTDTALAAHTAKFVSGRTEFLRQIFKSDLKKAITAVRLKPLCEWLQQTYAAFDEAWYCEALELEFSHATFPSQEPPRSKPRWEKDHRELWYGEILCKKYKRSAPNQEQILDSFQELGWPNRIDDPLPPGRLADTIDNMQESLRESPITLERDGTGKGIVWRKK